MNMRPKLVYIDCPNCGSSDNKPWAIERGFSAVQCSGCQLLFVNPRPAPEYILEAVKTGAHNVEITNLVVTDRHIPRRIDYYEKILRPLFKDLWKSGRAISWLDVGAGYGEVVEAVKRLAPAGSAIRGLEPMEPKASAARARGLSIEVAFLTPDYPKVDIISTVNVFSHIPDFNEFLNLIKSVLKPGGEIFIETGNLADLHSRKDFGGTLGLPDHLVFAGESQMKQYLDRAGFQIVVIEKRRHDGLLFFTKSVIKRLIGRPTHVKLPYISDYRTLLIRARLSSSIG